MAHAVSAATIYLYMVDLPSVVGGTSPMLAATEAALASSAIAKLLLFVQEQAYDRGLQGDGTLERQFVNFAKNALGRFAEWGAKALRDAPQNDPGVQGLRRVIEDVQQSPWAAHEQLAARLGLLLGQSPRTYRLCR
jgi:hypothetical protein